MTYTCPLLDLSATHHPTTPITPTTSNHLQPSNHHHQHQPPTSPLSKGQSPANEVDLNGVLPSALVMVQCRQHQKSTCNAVGLATASAPSENSSSSLMVRSEPRPASTPPQDQRWSLRSVKTRETKQASRQRSEASPHPVGCGSVSSRSDSTFFWQCGFAYSRRWLLTSGVFLLGNCDGVQNRTTGAQRLTLKTGVLRVLKIERCTSTKYKRTTLSLRLTLETGVLRDSGSSVAPPAERSGRR